MAPLKKEWILCSVLFELIMMPGKVLRQKQGDNGKKNHTETTVH